MTSKEALENWYQTNSANTKMYEYEQHYRIIKKDLEVLEILKKNFVDLEVIGMLNHYEDYILTEKENRRNKDFILNETDWKKVKEWLEE